MSWLFIILLAIVAVPVIMFLFMFAIFFAGAWVNRPSARWKNNRK